MSATTMEYLGAEGRAPRRAPRLVMVVLVVLAGVVAAFLWWNDTSRASANDDLVTAFTAADARAQSGERQVQGMLAYASPLIWSASVPEDVRAGLRRVVEGSAAEVAADFGVLRQQVEATRVLPWHEEQEQARQDLLAFIDAQQVRFAGIAADASDIDLVLAGGPLPNGRVLSSLRASGATGLPAR